jgi:hypothetical protein
MGFDPFPNGISQSSFTVEVKDFVVIPNSDGAVVRVNQLLTQIIRLSPCHVFTDLVSSQTL